MRSLDLFTGIGGITLALAGLVHPVAYCDIDGSARAVLARRMADRHLPRAPVSHDVKTLDAAWLKSQNKHKPDVIVGGFPCIGFSSMGLRTAFEGTDGSALFSEILRLADELRPAALFLENVPNLLNMGMHVVVRELVVKRGYDLTWCVIAASDVGAPHTRRRWFCLATSPKTFPPLLPALVRRLGGPFTTFARRWGTGGEHLPRMVTYGAGTQGCASASAASPRTLLRKGGGSREAVAAGARRLAMLGNSVVPDAVRAAFKYLVLDVAARRDGAVPSGGQQRYVPWDLGKARGPKRWPTHGHVEVGTGTPRQQQPHVFSARPGPGVERPLPYLRLVLDPRAFRGTVRASPLRTSGDVRAPMRLRLWATPRHGNTGASCSMTQRSYRDLPTQVRFERGTPDGLRAGHTSPEFVEWMMGYPRGWTKI